MMSSVQPEGEGEGLPPASRVGADLRSARERLGWELPAIAAHLRIRLPFLEAIEEGRTADLPGNAYALGFLRTYAKALGLDPDETARRFREEASHVNRKTELDFPAPVPERGVPAGAVVLLGAVLVIAAYAGWYRMSGNGRPESEPVQPVPPRLMPLAEAPPPRPGTAPGTTPGTTEAGRQPMISPAAKDAAATPGTGEGSPGVPAGQQAAASVPTALSTATLPLASAPASPVPAAQPAGLPMPTVISGPAAAAAATPPPQAAAPSSVPPGPDGSRITLRAKADSWVQVRDRQGTVLLSRVLRNGEVWPVPAPAAGKQLLLTTGNAGGTELLVDGTVSPSLGTDGAVRRDLPLDPDLIRDGKLAAAVPGAVPGAGTPAKPVTKVQ